VLRIGLPIALVAAILLVFAANYVPTVGGLRLPGDLGKLVIKGTKVTMQQPRLTGYTVDSRPYEFSASSAEQDITKPDVMELHQIKAKMEMEDATTINVVSASGTYDIKSEMLTLTEQVDIRSSSGYEAQLGDAVIDVHKGTVTSEKPLWVKMAGAVIRAKRLEVRDSGELIRFGGGVTVNAQPNEVQAALQARNR
jgi:lipopolysaccharide export system protein LptC